MTELVVSALLFLPLAAGAFWYSFAIIFRRFFTRKSTVLYDLPSVGKPRADSQRIKGTAAVCGGSFSGLWTARILSDHFEDVLIVEPEVWLGTSEGRDTLYDEKGIKLGPTHPRTRVQQYTTAHALQPLSYKALKHLFPNIDEEVKKSDGRLSIADFKVHFSGGQIMQPPEDKRRPEDRLQNFFFSRDAYERLLRRLVMSSSSRIRWLAGTAVSVRTVKNDPMTLSSVVVRLPDNSEQVIEAALVADCSGTSQAGLKWLKRVGAKADETPGKLLSLADLRLSYQTVQQTRTYRFYVPPEARDKLPLPNGYENTAWIYSCMPMFGVSSKSFLADRIEGHRIRLMFGSWGDEPLPDFSDIKEFFGSLSPEESVPDWFMSMLDILLEYEHLAEVSSSKYPVLSCIRYEQAAYLPSNFVAIGDSVMQVNPTFAQGCSKACVGAITLDSILRSRSTKNSTSIPAGFSRRFFKKLVCKTSSAWEGTKPIDYLFHTTIPVKGEKLSDERLKGRMMLTIMLLARTDKSIDSALFNVVNFLAPPTDLIHPITIAKVLLFWARQQFCLA